MSDDPTSPDDARTIINLSPSAGAPAADAPVEATTPPAADQGDGPAPQAPPAPTPAPRSSLTAFGQPIAEPRQIQVGDVLNHIFEVRRFIARGGMGEVFEGVNINSDERVAIKGILPHLSADAAVLEMFRKEARTLTRLSHPGLVQYRVLAQEPQIGAFYIVTEFIEGRNLSDLLSDIDASPAQLVTLTKRLAEGLAAAHSLGAIHRDISPDNVMLEASRLDRAKIIDFGIAKDLTPNSKTIVGDGFAGKLNYVAPEQLGDFNREIGAWTDVYSLGLTILAVAQRRDVDMGGSFVDAIDKRRAGPDLTPVPEELRGVLARMLEPDPAKRTRSMEDVVAMLANPGAVTMPAAAGTSPPAQPASQWGPVGDAAPAGEHEAAAPAAAYAEPTVFAPAAALAATATAEPMPEEAGDVAEATTLPVWRRPPVMAGGGALVLLLAVVAGWHMLSSKPPPVRPVAKQAAPAIGAIPGNPAQVAREAVAAGLGKVPCSWLDLGNVDANGGALTLGFSGVAGKPAEAQGAITQILASKGLPAASLDFNDVAPIAPGECGPVEAFRAIRAEGAPHLSSAQRRFTISTLPSDAGADAGKPGAQAILDFDLNGVRDDVAVIGLEPSGAMTELVKSRAAFNDPNSFQQIRPGVYRLKLNITHADWSGLLMLTGKGPFDAALLNSPAGSHGADWPARFTDTARRQGWRAEMVWVQTVN